jgi:Big-like domain-containing protein/Ig-like domain-containing protein/List-Bact-rpt repeat protein
MKNYFPKLSRVFLTSLAGFLTGVSCLGDSAVFIPDADAYIRSASPDTTGGSEPTVVSGLLGDRSGRETRRAFLRFDLSGSIPAGATIESVSLAITVTKTPQPPANSVFALRPVLQPWSEGEVTWNSRLNGTPWAAPGADDGADTVLSPSSTTQVLGFLGSYTFPSTAALVSDVQAWVNNPGNNFGWLLISEDEQTPMTARRFGAREDPPNAPVLQITYSIAPLTVVVQPPSQNVLVGSTVNFQAIASGTPPLTYQWLFNGNPLSGATIDNLTLGNVQTNQSGDYTVIVSSQSGSVTSAPAVLVVGQPSAGVPVVTITSPTNGSKFPAHADVLLAADASESNGLIARVDFFLGTNLVGSAGTAPFQFLLANVAAGNYVLSARATDDRGTNGFSPSAAFSVFNPPVINLTAPGAGSRIPIGTNVTLSATVMAGARIVRVDFFAARVNPASATLETNLIGSASAPPFTIQWTPSAPGDYLLSAFAIDELGQTGNSSNVLARVFVPELILPGIKVTQGPANFATTSESPAMFSGTASDNLGLDHVEVQVLSGRFLQTAGPILIASGTTEWTAEVMLAPGKNAVRFQSVDLAGNKSPIATRFLTYQATAPLAIIINGEGKVVPNRNGRTLVLGKTYRVTARPAKGFIFAGWTNGAATNNPRLSFEMRTNLVLVANFVPNPFLDLAGTYGGLFFDADTNRFRPENAGDLRLQLTKQGAFSGKIKMQGTSYPFHGQFDATGKARVGVPRPALFPVSLSLQADLTNATATISGGVTLQADANSLISNLLAVRKTTRKTDDAPPQIGTHSFVLVQTTDDGLRTAATATAIINASGGVIIIGAFPETPAFHFTTIISKTGDVPVYILQAQDQDLLIGWLSFSEDSGTPSGLLFRTDKSFSNVEVLNTTGP